MNDNDLREMFRRREADVQAPVTLPEPVKGRTRRRQTVLSLMAGLVAIAVVASVVLLIPRQSRSGSNGSIEHPAASQTGEVRTATAGDFRISYPSDWFLTVTQQDYSSPQGLQLSNFDPGFPKGQPCAEGSSGMTGNGVWLRLDLSTGNVGAAPAWPVDLVDGAFPTSCSGSLLVASWFDAGSGISFQGEAVVGPEASAEDHQRLLDAFSSVQIPDSEHAISNSFFSGDVKDSTAAAVLAGTPDWTLAAHPDDYSPGLVLELGYRKGLGFAGGGSLGGTKIDAPDQIVVDPAILAGRTLLIGAVSLDAARVEVRTDDGQTSDADLVTPPPSLSAGFRSFSTELEGIPTGTIVVYDANGGVLTQERFYPGRYTSPRYPGFQVQPDGTIVDAKIHGGIWRLTDTGTSIELSDGTTVLASVPDDPSSPLAYATHTFSDGNDSQTIVFGTLTPDITYLITTGKQGESSGILVPLGDGRIAFWTWTLDEDRLLAINAHCSVVEAIDLKSGALTNEPIPPECAPA